MEVYFSAIHRSRKDCWDARFRGDQPSHNSTGHELPYTITPTAGTRTTCTQSPHGPGPTEPLTVGQTWQPTFTQTCTGRAPLTIAQSGTVSDVETLVPPTVNVHTHTLRLTGTWSWTSHGTTHTENTSVPVQETQTTPGSGTAPSQAHFTSITRVLQSLS